MAETNEHEHIHYSFEQQDTEMENVRAEPPQLNDEVPGHGDLARGGEHITDEGRAGQVEHVVHSFVCILCGFQNTVPSGGSKVHVTPPIEGDEGVGDHQLEIDGRFFSLRTLWLAVARHRRCTCHAGIIEDEYAVIDTPLPSGIHSPSSSMYAHAGDSSMESSFYMSAFVSRAASPGPYARYPLGPFDDSSSAREQVYYFHNSPLQLGLDPPLAATQGTMQVWHHPYPTTLSLGDSEGSDDEAY
jgi:hypothetical protein